MARALDSYGENAASIVAQGGESAPKLDAHRIRLLLLGAIVSVVLLPFALYCWERATGSGRVLRGVWVDQMPVSGLDRGEARVAMRRLTERMTKVPLYVRVQTELFQVDPKQLGFRLDVEKTLDRAFAQGRNGNLVEQFGWWLARWMSPVQLSVDGKFEPSALEATFAQWEALAITDLPTPGGVVLQSGKPIPVYPRPGRLIVRRAAEHRLMETLRSRRRTITELSTTLVQSKVGRGQVDAAVASASRLLIGPIELVGQNAEHRIRFSIEDLGEALASRIANGSGIEIYFDPRVVENKLVPLRPQLEVTPVDARFVIEGTEKIRIEPSRHGTRLSAEQIAEAMLQAAQSPERRAPLPIAVDAEPKLTTEQAQALNIRRLISHFTTRFECCPPRVKNIERIAELINGAIVRPGETFSVNEFIGPRTKERGFVEAPTIEEGEMVDSVGGGISQFATTLFNAVFHGGYDIIERQPHTYWFSRYPMGHEATLSFPKPDLVFKNDTEAGMLIKAFAMKTSVTVQIYGDNGGRKVLAEVSKRHDITEPPVERVANPKLAPDRERLKEPGAIGWTVVVSRTVTFPDGTSKKEERKVIYSPRVRRIEVHPCRIPRGQPGHTGELCPVPDTVPDVEREESPVE